MTPLGPGDEPKPDVQPGSGDEVDAWLRQALRHAPDAGAGPPRALSEAIVAEARASVAGRSEARPLSSSGRGRLTSLMGWLAQPPVAAGFAGVMAMMVAGLIWWDRPLDADRPSPESATAPSAAVTATATAPAPAPAPAPRPVPVPAPAPALSADASVSEAEARNEPAAPRSMASSKQAPRAADSLARNSSATRADAQPITPPTPPAPLGQLIASLSAADEASSPDSAADAGAPDAALRSWLLQAEAATAGRWRSRPEAAARVDEAHGDEKRAGETRADKARADNPAIRELRRNGRVAAVITVEPGGLSLRLQPDTGAAQNWFAALPPTVARRLAGTQPAAPP